MPIIRHSGGWLVPPDAPWGIFTLGQDYPRLGASKRRAAHIYSDNLDKECPLVTQKSCSHGLRIDSSHPCIQPGAPDNNVPVATTSTDSPGPSRGGSRDHAAAGGRSLPGGAASFIDRERLFAEPPWNAYERSCRTEFNSHLRTSTIAEGASRRRQMKRRELEIRDFGYVFHRLALCQCPNS